MALPPLQIQIPPPPGQPQVMVMRVFHPHNPPGQQNQQAPPALDSDGSLGALMETSSFKVLANMQGRSACVTLLRSNGPWKQLPNEFVDSVFQATQGIPVEELILKHHQLSLVPGNLIQMNSVSVLDISFNNLMVVPDVLCQLHQLQKLHLQHNQIASIPERLGQLTVLKELYLQHNLLLELPTAMCHCTSLEILNIEDNKIQSFSMDIVKLRNLKQLHASCNTLDCLPVSLCHLSNIEELHLSNNNIQHINDISTMKSLKQLHLANNRLQFLPPCIANMYQLQGLTLSGNPLRFPPLSACRAGVKSMQQYMQDKIKDSVVDYGQGDALITNIYYTGSDYEVETGTESPFENID